jgi:UPF0271 protein
MGRILINCDLGENESDEQTKRLLDLVDAANICCGVHAGSVEKTRRTLRLALEKGRLIGAHPGLEGEGGRGGELPSLDAFGAIVKQQIAEFMKVAGECGAKVDYVKLHGSLYNAVEHDAAYADAYPELVQDLDPKLGIFALAGGAVVPKSEKVGIKVWREGFADRGYLSNGRLVSRSDPGAVLSAQAGLGRFRRWQSSGRIDTIDGGSIPVQADTFCVHSDSGESETLLAGLRKMLSF